MENLEVIKAEIAKLSSVKMTANMYPLFEALMNDYGSLCGTFNCTFRRENNRMYLAEFLRLDGVHFVIIRESEHEFSDPFDSDFKDEILEVYATLSGSVALSFLTSCALESAQFCDESEYFPTYR